jgi:cytochrome c2
MTDSTGRRYGGQHRTSLWRATPDVAMADSTGHHYGGQHRTSLWRTAPGIAMASNTGRSVITYILQACHKMPTFKKNENGINLWDVEDMKIAMGYALMFNLPYNSLQDNFENKERWHNSHLIKVTYI